MESDEGGSASEAEMMEEQDATGSSEELFLQTLGRDPSVVPTTLPASATHTVRQMVNSLEQTSGSQIVLVACTTAWYTTMRAHHRKRAGRVLWTLLKASVPKAQYDARKRVHIDGERATCFAFSAAGLMSLAAAARATSIQALNSERRRLEAEAARAKRQKRGEVVAVDGADALPVPTPVPALILGPQGAHETALVVPESRVCGTPGCRLSDGHLGACSADGVRLGRRSASAAASSLRPPPVSLEDALSAIEAGVVALGDWEDHFRKADRGKTWLPTPPLRDVDTWRRLLDEAMRPDACAILMIAGSMVPDEIHSPLLRLIAERLPASSVIAMNVGEFERADAAAYDALAEAVAKPACVLGHLYFKDPVSEAERRRKRDVRAQLARNCFKHGYLQQLARDEVWALGGANCWHNFTNLLHRRAKAAANDAVLAAERPQRWWTRGALAFSVSGSDAYNVLAYLQGHHNHDPTGHLLVGAHRIGGFSNERRVRGAAHATVAQGAALQWQHTRHFPSATLPAARATIPGFAAILDAVRDRLPATHHTGRAVVALGVNILDQGSTHTRLTYHNDLDEELQAIDEIEGGGEARRVRRLLYTAIVSLAGGRTSLNILGKLGGEVFFAPEAGAGLLFRSALTHATGATARGVFKMTIFFGYPLELEGAHETAPPVLERRRIWERRLWGGSAAWRHVFASSITPEPTATEGEGGIMGTLTADSLAHMLDAMQLRHNDALFDIGVGTGAMLGAAHVLVPTVRLAGCEADRALIDAARRNLAALHAVAELAHTAVQAVPNLGGATVAFCFSQGLKDASDSGDAAAAVLRACHATPTLRLLTVVHDARERSHQLVVFAERERAAARAERMSVTMAGGGERYSCYLVRFEPAANVPSTATTTAPRTRSAYTPSAAAAAAVSLSHRAPPCLVLNLDRRPDRLLRMHKLLDAYEWLAWRRLEAVDGCVDVEAVQTGVAPQARARLDDPTPTVLRNGRFWPRLTRGAASCALSHRAAWCRLEALPLEECLLVLEDNVTALCPEFERRLQDLLSKLSRKEHWRLCLLGSHECGDTLLAQNARASLVELQQGQFSTGLFGYLLHRRALPQLRGAFPLHEQLDVALSTTVEWGHGARWEARPPLLTTPRSEALRDTDVQILETQPGGMMQLLAAADAADGPRRSSRRI